ncbi:hypothetical protein BC629DRAFT_1444882 [Irpex lacteus]|nr:hypothetical protein BC629DRAFT_1444882 [Irpex lacteus]
MYQRDLSQRAMLAKKRISELAPSSAYNASGALNETGQFKQNVVPLLEKVFSANSYPSGDEKRTLAALTGMEYKQVKTWFQNKRSRCKREGKEIQKFVFVIKGDDGQNPSQCGVAGGPPVSSLAPRPCTPAAPSQTLAPTSRAVTASIVQQSCKQTKQTTRLCPSMLSFSRVPSRRSTACIGVSDCHSLCHKRCAEPLVIAIVSLEAQRLCTDRTDNAHHSHVYQEIRRYSALAYSSVLAETGSRCRASIPLVQASQIQRASSQTTTAPLYVVTVFAFF